MEDATGADAAGHAEDADADADAMDAAVIVGAPDDGPAHSDADGWARLCNDMLVPVLEALFVLDPPSYTRAMATCRRWAEAAVATVPGRLGTASWGGTHAGHEMRVLLGRRHVRPTPHAWARVSTGALASGDVAAAVWIATRMLDGTSDAARQIARVLARNGGALFRDVCRLAAPDAMRFVCERAWPRAPKAFKLANEARPLSILVVAGHYGTPLAVAAAHGSVRGPLAIAAQHCPEAARALHAALYADADVVQPRLRHGTIECCNILLGFLKNYDGDEPSLRAHAEWLLSEFGIGPDERAGGGVATHYGAILHRLADMLRPVAWRGRLGALRWLSELTYKMNNVETKKNAKGENITKPVIRELRALPAEAVGAESFDMLHAAAACDNVEMLDFLIGVANPAFAAFVRERERERAVGMHFGDEPLRPSTLSRKRKRAADAAVPPAEEAAAKFAALVRGGGHGLLYAAARARSARMLAKVWSTFYEFSNFYLNSAQRGELLANALHLCTVRTVYIATRTPRPATSAERDVLLRAPWLFENTSSGRARRHRRERIATSLALEPSGTLERIDPLPQFRFGNYLEARPPHIYDHLWERVRDDEARLEAAAEVVRIYATLPSPERHAHLWRLCRIALRADAVERTENDGQGAITIAPLLLRIPGVDILLGDKRDIEERVEALCRGSKKRAHESIASVPVPADGDGDGSDGEAEAVAVVVGGDYDDDDDAIGAPVAIAAS